MAWRCEASPELGSSAPGTVRGDGEVGEVDVDPLPKHELGFEARVVGAAGAVVPSIAALIEGQRREGGIAQAHGSARGTNDPQAIHAGFARSRYVPA